MPTTTSRGYSKAVGGDNWRAYLKTSLAATMDLLNTDVGAALAALGQALIGTVGGATVPATSTNYWCPGVASFNATENLRQVYMPRAGTIANFFVNAITAQPGTGTFVLTVRKNGVNTVVTVTIGAGASGGFSDVAHSVAVAQGDLVSVGAVNNASGASAQIGGIGFTLGA